MLVQGHKKGESNPRSPVIAQNSVSSVQTVKILYGLAEGEIAGLANGAESIRLEKTPIRTNGVDNFKNVSFETSPFCIDVTSSLIFLHEGSDK